MSSLQHQLAELKSVKTAPALWREQTRARLLKNIAATSAKPYSFSARLVYNFQQARLALAPLPLASILVAALIILVGYSPFTGALAASLPGNPLYPVKRTVEKFELSIRSSSDSQGLFYLTLAARRLAEAQAVTEVSTQAELLRDYNITLGFAQASLETGLASTDLARAYDQATDVLAANLVGLKVAPTNHQVYLAALDLTQKVSARALALLVSSHASEQNGVEPMEVASRLSAEIAKVEAKLESVEVKIKEFPQNSPAPKVVIGAKAKVVPVSEASRQAKESLAEAKELIARNEFGLALQKVQESEDLTAKSEAAVTEEEVAVEGEAGVEPSEEEQVAEPEPAVEGESTAAGEPGAEAAPAETPPETEQPPEGSSNIQ